MPGSAHQYYRSCRGKDVKIRIEDVDDTIQLTIIDDGKGFDINQKKQTSGLANMRGRAASINGRLTVQSKPGNGTMICLAIEKPSSLIK